MSLLNSLQKTENTDTGSQGQRGFLTGTINDFLEDAPLAIHFFDEGGNLLDCNRAAMRVYDMDDKQDYIDNYFMFMPFNQPDGRRSKDVLKDTIAEAKETGRTRVGLMYRKADGTSTMVNSTCVSFEYGLDPVIVMFSMEENSGSGGDRDFEADLRATLMLDSTPMACFLADSSCNALDCNAEALQLFGYASKDEATKRFSEICPETQTLAGHDVESMNDAIGKALLSGRHVFEFTCFDTVGKPIPCNITLVRIYYRREHVVAIYIQDLREMKAIIEEMKRIEVAEEESRAKSRFLAKMSHEIRTPLTAILGIAEVQLLGGKNTSEMEDIFLQIYTSSNLLLRIINDLLDLSKVEAEKMSIISHVYEIPALISDTVQLNLVYLGDKEINFEIEVDSNVPNSLIGDELRIKQIMNNLLSNAFKYTLAGKVTLAIEVELTEDMQTVLLVIRVNDTGMGMTREQLDCLFEDEYVRFNEEHNYKIQGAGLGLSITHQLVSMMGGSIVVDSTPSEGTQIIVKLPQEKHGDELLGAETARNLGNLKISQMSRDKASNFTRKHMPYGRVLVVDDTKSNLHVIKSMLAPYGLYIETVESGSAAITKVESGEVFDIIFMDHMMPDLDGIETTKIILALGYRGPIVALTANAIVGQAEVFMKNGFSDFLSKPIDIYKLDNCLTKYIYEKHEKGEAEPAVIEEAPPKPSVPDGLMQAFLEDAEVAINNLESLVQLRAWEENDLKKYIISTHGLKSALSNIGEAELSEEAYELELTGGAMDMQTRAMRTSEFLEKLNRVIARFSKG